MNRTFTLLLAAVAAGSMAVACSAAPTGDLTGGDSNDSKPSKNNGGGSDTTTPAPSDTTTDVPTGTGAPSTPPPPASGPGSASSAAHLYFKTTVFPAMANCSACHSSGADAAPTFLNADADKAYSSMDLFGLIQTDSRLLKKGAHDSGKAPALTADQSKVITDWLAKEATERTGKSAPVNVFAKLATCMDKTQFTAIGLDTLRTKPRNNENQNRYTGGNNAECSSCHGDAQTVFFDQLGSKVGDTTFETTQTQPYINIYFGLNGTDPVAAGRIEAWATKQAAQPAYSPHPMFNYTATVKANLDKFVQDTLDKYKAGTCTGTAPAATP